MRKFITSLYVFIRLYFMGYNWSGLFDLHSGFYRFNYEKNNEKEFAIMDIDFGDEKEFNNGHSFSVIHGGVKNEVLFRVDDDKITTHSRRICS